MRPLGKIRADKRQIEQVLINLVVDLLYFAVDPRLRIVRVA